MSSVQVGPFVVRKLNVEQGLKLLDFMDDADQSKFRNALLMTAVTLDGEPINERDFADVVPHLGDLLRHAMELNGFSTPK